MQKNIYLKIHVLIILVLALYSTALAMDMGPVRQIYSVSHAVNVPSTDPYIQIKWYPPENGIAEGYYVTFNTKMTHVFDEFNTADNDVELIRNETQVTSQDFSGADDVNYYCHIAAFALDTNDKEFIGPTVSEGPFRIDTIAPLNPVVNAPSAVRERMITIQPGAYHATEMYISNAGYELNGQWEAFAQKRQWELRDIQGNQIIYVVFRDLAGNTAKASTAVRYDTIGPIPEFQTDETMPARSSPISISIVFNEPVTQFSENDIQTSNCEIQKFVSDQPDLSARFFLECIPFTQGNFQLSIMENVLQDEAGNANQASDTFEWIYDISLPQIQSIADQMIIENAGSKSIAFSITNSHAFNGILTIQSWAEQSTLVDTQGLVINGQGNPFETTLTAGTSQTLSLEITPRPDQSGETLIHVMVSDATGMTAHTAFQLNVWDAPNISPISDLQMEESTLYSIAIVLTDVYKQNLILSMTSSNPALMGPDHMTLIGDAIFNSSSFPYSILPANSEMIAIQLNLYFEPPKNKHGSVNLTLTATNIKNLSQTREFKLDILPVNDLPELVMDSTVRSFEDQTVKVPVSITDIDQDELVVQALSSNETLIPKNFIRWIRNGTEYFNPISVPLQTSMTQDLILKLPPAADAFGEATITVRVADKGGVTENTFLLTILSVNDPPVSPDTMSFTINENVPSGTKVGKISVSDVDSPSLTFTMIDIKPLNHFQLYPSTGDIIVNGNIDFETASLYHLTVQVSDTYSKSTTLVDIHVANMNDHSPQLDDSFHIDVQENTSIGTIIKTISASDIDNDPLFYTLTFQTATVPFAISRHTGEIWINDTVDYETKSLYSSVITVTDGLHQEERPLTITVADINEAPAISGIPALTVVQGQEYYFKPITYDPDINDQLFFYIANEPQWADLDEETGKLYGIPKNEHVGVWKNVSISVRDKSNLSASLPLFNITVINANDPPVLHKAIDNVSVDKNNSFSYTIPQDTFIDPDIGDVLTYHATELNKDQLPDWLAFDSDTRHFSGTPGNFDGGVYIIQVTALDSFLTATATSFLLTVIDHNIVPQITLPSPKIDFYENNNAAFIDEFARLEDEDSLDFDNGVLSAFFDKNGTPDDQLLIKDHGLGNMPVSLDKNKVYSGEQLIGTFSGGTYPEPLAVTFTHWANVEIVKSLLRNIMFINDSENPVDSERRLAVTISDGDGGTSEPVFKTIHVHAINDDPILSIGNHIIDNTYSLPDINENETIIFENDRRILIDDKDSGDGVMTASISAIKGIITFDPNNIDNLKDITGNNTSNVTFSGSLEQINAGLNALKYKSNKNSFGTEAIRFYMKDNGYSGFGGGEFVYRNISFHINEVNDPPQFSSIPLQVIMEDTPAKIAFSITETDFQNVMLQIKDFQNDMIDEDSLSIEGPLVEDNFIINTLANDHADLTLNVTPYLNKTGNTYIILILNDGAFTVTTQIDLYITPINDPPVIINQSKTIYEDAALPISLSVTDKEGDSLQLSLVTPPEHGTVTLDSVNKQFIYTPQKDNTKSVYFEYCAHDNEFQSNIGRVDISIIPVNDPPQIDPINNLTLLGLQTKTISFSVSDVDSINVIVSAESNNTQIFPNNQANISLIPNNNNWYTLYLDPMKNQFGTTTITIIAQDSLKASAYQSFEVYVKQLDNTAPVITLNSPWVVQIDQNGEYHEPGYFALDDIDGDVTQSVSIQNHINTQIPGIYHVTYFVEDAAGNKSEPVERMVIVNKKQFTSQKISGNIVDDTGNKVGFVKIIVEGQGHTYTTNSLHDGYFKLEIPITFDGSVWQMHLERADYFSQTLEFISPRSFETITLFSKDSNNAEVIKGQCYSHQVDGTNIVLTQVILRARSIENDAVIATCMSDDKGQYTLAVDVRDRPYSFEATKYGYETKSFDLNSSAAIVLMPLTTIFIEQPESMTEHHTANNFGFVSIFVTANPPFTGADNELRVNLITGDKLDPIFVNNKYQIKYNKYTDFTINIRADTTDDRNVDTDYYVEQTIFFKSIRGSAEVYVTKGQSQYLITQPFYVEQSGLSSFMWIDRGGLSDLDTPRNLNYTIRDYVFPLDDELYDHIVEFDLKDAFGRNIVMVDRPICVGIGFSPPVTRDSLDNQTYELIWAETVSDLLLGQGQIESSFTLFDRHVTFCTSHLSAFGFRKSDGASQESGGGDDSGGGCFLMSMPLPGKEHNALRAK
jgi:hypothetical protein